MKPILVYSSRKDTREHSISVFTQTDFLDDFMKSTKVPGKLMFFGQSYSYIPSKEYFHFIKKFFKRKKVICQKSSALTQNLQTTN